MPLMELGTTLMAQREHNKISSSLIKTNSKPWIYQKTTTTQKFSIVGCTNKSLELVRNLT